MKNLITAAIALSGAIMAGQAVFGQAVPNDLYFGFENQAAGGTQDYIINLGPASGIVGGSTVVTLSSYFSLADFNAVLGVSSTMYGGVVGAANNSNSGTPNTAYVYTTELRSGGAGTPSVPGSTAPAALTRSFDNGAYTAISGMVSPSAGTGVLDSTKSWESDVEPTFTTQSFYGQTGVNPDSLVSKTVVLYEDLWYTTNNAISGSKPFSYLGYFTLDLTGGGAKLTFTPKNAPAQLSAPTITSISKSAGTVTLIWSTVASHTYQLQYTASLSPTNWINLGSGVLANNAFMTNTDSSFGSSPQRFYRVTAQ